MQKLLAFFQNKLLKMEGPLKFKITPRFDCVKAIETFLEYKYWLKAQKNSTFGAVDREELRIGTGEGGSAFSSHL